MGSSHYLFLTLHEINVSHLFGKLKNGLIVLKMHPFVSAATVRFGDRDEQKETGLTLFCVFLFAGK